MSRLTQVILCTILLLTFFACSKESVTYDCANLTPTYTGMVKAIMDAKCAYSGCHSAADKDGGIDLSSYAVVSSEANDAAFMGSINHESSYNAMPENKAQLTYSERQQIYCWIESGKPQ